MDLYLTEPVGPFATAVGNTFSTFTAKQDVSPQPLPVIPAGKLRLGSKINLYACGEFTDTATVNLTMGFWFGTRALAITGDVALSSVISLASSAVAWPWVMEWDGICTAVGTAGSLTGTGTLMLGTALTSFGSPVPIPITQALRTVASFDTTIERAIGVSATWGTSAAGNSIKTIANRVLIFN